MFRNFLSILSGLFAAFLIVLAIEKMLPLIFNVAPFDEAKDINAMKEMIKNLPPALLVSLALMYGIAAFAGSYVTLLVSGNQNMGLIMTVVFFIVVLINFLSIPHPIWTIALGCFATIMGGYFGSRYHNKST